MNQSILFSCLLTSYLIFAPGDMVERTERTASKTKPAVEKRSIEKPTVRKATTKQEDIPQTYQATHSPSVHEITHTTTSERLPHEINPKTKRSDFEDALKSRNLEKARDLYNEARNNLVKTKDFVIHLRDRYNNNGLGDLYGSGSRDDHRQQLAKDLHEIDPYLYQKFVDSFHDIKQKEKITSVVTEKNFITWLEQNPDYILNPSKFTGKPNEKTPLEDAIELKDATTINEIIRIARENKISSDQLIKPIKDKLLELLDKDPAEVTEYLKTITDIGAPELTKIVIRNTMRDALEHAIETGNIEIGKLALEIAKENDVSLQFLTKPLIEKYKKLTKSSSKYLQKIYSFGDDALSHFIYEQITTDTKPQP